METELIEEIVETGTVSKAGLVFAAGMITIGAVLVTTGIVRKKIAARREAKMLAGQEDISVEVEITELN